MNIQPTTLSGFPRLLILPVLALLPAIGGGCATTDKQVIGQANQFHQNLEPAVMERPRPAPSNADQPEHELIEALVPGPGGTPLDRRKHLASPVELPVDQPAEHPCDEGQPDG